jgi:hypothetical protein
MGYVSTLVKIQAALEHAGIQFIDDDELGGFGVRMATKKRKSTVSKYMVQGGSPLEDVLAKRRAGDCRH